jgi:heme exporter protein C
MKTHRHHGESMVSGLTTVLMVVSLYAIFLYAPIDQSAQSGGVAQKIFYLHLPLALLSFVAFFIVFVASMAYLYTRAGRWDRMARSAAEVGVLFCTLVLVTGSIWAKSTWNVWWTWDPRLTTVLLLWCMYAAYLMLRAMLNPGSQTLTIAAVFGMISFVNVPITFLAIRMWRSIHPVVIDKQGVNISPPMQHALFMTFAAFTLLFVALLRLRLRIEAAEQRALELEWTLDE